MHTNLSTHPLKSWTKCMHVRTIMMKLCKIVYSVLSVWNSLHEVGRHYEEGLGKTSVLGVFPCVFLSGTLLLLVLSSTLARALACTEPFVQSGLMQGFNSLWNGENTLHTLFTRKKNLGNVSNTCVLYWFELGLSRKCFMWRKWYKGFWIISSL